MFHIPDFQGIVTHEGSKPDSSSVGHMSKKFRNLQGHSDSPNTNDKKALIAFFDKFRARATGARIGIGILKSAVSKRMFIPLSDDNTPNRGSWREIRRVAR